MDTSPSSDPRLDAYRALLDDTAPVVRAALTAEFAGNSARVVPFLQEIVRGKNRPLAWHATWFLQQLKFSDPVAEFRDFIRSLHYELETGSFLLSRIHSPRLDVGACYTLFDEIAARCRELIVDPSTARDQCRVINRVLFHEYGFHGNVEDYMDPRNSFIDEVLARRKGLPITLSMIYVMVAQRLGLTLEPVGLPGHFVVGCFLEDTPFFIDPFDQGALRTAVDLFALLREHHLSPTIADLAPTPVREVLCRCCRNLSHHYAVAHDELQSQLYAGLVEEFEATHERELS